jgi:hypothetical protein
MKTPPLVQTAKQIWLKHEARLNPGVCLLIKPQLYKLKTWLQKVGRHALQRWSGGRSHEDSERKRHFNFKDSHLSMLHLSMLHLSMLGYPASDRLGHGKSSCLLHSCWRAREEGPQAACGREADADGTCTARTPLCQQAPSSHWVHVVRAHIGCMSYETVVINDLAFCRTRGGTSQSCTSAQ